MKVGFIGLGHMGAAMAANLVKAKHEVTVFNRTAQKRRSLVELGAREATRVAEACTGDAVITMLADDAALREVAFAEGGIVASLARNAIHVSMSTISPDLSRSLAQAHERAGQRYVAAPVFGRPEVAAAAKLFVVASGEATAIDACAPLFDAMGQKTYRVGSDPEAANFVKLGGNFMLAAVIETLGEVMALLGKAGIEPRTFLEVLTSTLFPAPAYRSYGALIADRQFEPAAFAAKLGYKDVRLALSAAETLRVPMPLASLLRDRFLRLLAQGGENLDWSALAKLAADDAGPAPSVRS
ncbi:MAG: NAD(P)-dependent oxidoreductase [Steroidobacteraceae bacterium]|nr:NAD(P)-dependent oxidoreductase [Steroidobacteraceae bacterium]